jgi:hypothetical protein
VTATNATDRKQREREHYRPPIGVPLERREWWGVPLSALAHLAVLLAFLIPFWATADVLPPSGAGGAGPAGGGGGGSAGGGAAGSPTNDAERLHFVAVAPPPAPSVVPEEKQPTTPVPEPVKPPPGRP